MQIDDLDARIMSELEEDGRRSYRDISKRLGVAPGTVRSRALQLIRDGIFRVIGVADPWRLGYTFHATIGLRLTPGHSEEVGDLLSQRAEVAWVGLTSTGYDVMFELALPDSRSFGSYKEQVLAVLPGCQSVDAFVIWDVRKFHYRLLPPASRWTAGLDNGTDEAVKP